MSELWSQFLKSIAYNITPERTGNKKWIYATVVFSTCRQNSFSRHHTLCQT